METFIEFPYQSSGALKKSTNNPGTIRANSLLSIMIATFPLRSALDIRSGLSVVVIVGKIDFIPCSRCFFKSSDVIMPSMSI